MKLINRGISLIVLVITILVILILAGIVILSLSQNNPINSASEASFKQKVQEYSSELLLYISSQYTVTNGQFVTNTFWANSSGSSISGLTISDILKSLNTEDNSKFEISSGKLSYVGNNSQEIGWMADVILEQGLPLTYTRLSYLTSNNNQYIDTGVYGSNSIKTTLVFSIPYVAGDQKFLGSYGVSPNSGGFCFGALNNNWRFGYNGGWISNNIPAVANVKQTLVINNDSKDWWIDTTQIFSAQNFSSYTNGTVYVFGVSYNGTLYQKATMTLYELTMQDKTTNKKVRNFVPAKRNSDNVLGLYDLVGRQFYTNLGTGTFIGE